MRALAPTLALALAGCGDADPAPVTSDTFVAFDRDFASYAAWPRTDLGSLTLAGHPPGPRWVHRNRAPEGDAYPVGTIVVKVVQAEPDPSQWVLFAMVKRGGGFNPRGARGWEFFVLRLARDGTPVVVDRGVAPSLVGTRYDTGDAVGCNDCHGTDDARDVDGILTPALRPAPH